MVVAAFALQPSGGPAAFLGTTVFLTDEAEAKACLAGDMGIVAEPEKAWWEGLGPQLNKTALAAYSLWPEGRPPAHLQVKERNIRIREWCRANEVKGPPSNSTIYRFFHLHMPPPDRS